MSYPLINLLSPTHVAIHWGWLLVPLANLIVYLLILGVFVVGATVRLPGARKDLARARAENLGRNVDSDAARDGDQA